MNYCPVYPVTFVFVQVETEYFHQLLTPSLQQLGFQGHHFPKVGKEEGMAIFYKVSSMELLHHQEIVFKDIFAKV